MEREYPTIFVYREESNKLIDTLYLSFKRRNELRFNLTRLGLQHHVKEYPPTVEPEYNFDDFEDPILHTGETKSRWAKRATWTADVLYQRSIANGALKDLEKAIEIVQQNQQIPPSRSDLVRLGAYWKQRFTWSHDGADIVQSAGALTHALGSRPLNLDNDHNGQHLIARLWLRSMGMAFSDIQEIIEMGGIFNELDSSAPKRRWSAILFSGGLCGLKSYEWGKVGDIGRTISLFKKALEIQLENEFLTGECIYYLGSALAMRFERSKDVSDINGAIDMLHRAPRAGNVSMRIRLRNLEKLATAFTDRFFALSDVRDLDQSILQWEELANIAPSNQDPPGHLLALPVILIIRYTTLSNMVDLKRVACLCRELKDTITASNHPWHNTSFKQDLLCCLAVLTAFLYLDERGNNSSEVLTEIDSALRIFRHSSRKASYQSPSKPIFLGMCSLLLLLRFKVQGMAGSSQKLDADTLLEQIHTSEELFVLTRDKEPGDVRNCAEIALTWAGYYELLGQPPDPLKAKEIYELSKAVLRCELSSPSSRVRGAWFAGTQLIRSLGHGDKKMSEAFMIFKEAFMIFEEAIAILPTAAPVHSLRKQRYNVYDKDVSAHELGQLAVSAGLYAGKPASRCLAALEQCRGVTLGFTIDCRSTENLQELRKINAELFHKFNNLRSRADEPDGPCGGFFQPSNLGILELGFSQEKGKRQRVNDSKELVKTLQEIRNQPGFERFQLPPSNEQLVQMAKDGPIIIEVCTNIRSDAIIVTSSGVKSIPLPDLIFSDARNRIEPLSKVFLGKCRTYRSRTKKMEEFLLWLWRAAVKPVIDELKTLGLAPPNPQADQSMPARIWWIGAGFMGLAPFHAAGDHSPGSTNNTLSYAMSSYIPTIKALSYAREKPLTFLDRDSGGDSSLLMVAMSETPGHSPLESVDIEVGSIASLVPEGVRAEILPSPSVKDILEKLPSFNTVHFACHGFSDPKDPFNSHLLLHAGTSGVDKLTVGAISDINLKSAQIAYLSACSTAGIGSECSADESVHIASAFQLAGFSHVLANMWPSDDNACLKVSTEFYRNLFDGGLSKCGHRKVASAFHYAVKKLRDENLKSPLLWSPFIHTGA